MQGITLGDLKRELDKYPDDLDMWKLVGQVQTYTYKKYPSNFPTVYIGDRRILGADVTGWEDGAYASNRVNVRIYELADALLSVIADASKNQLK